MAGPLTVAQSLRYVLQVAKPLAALDEHSGVIHRDLKPANIFITSDDVVKVLDFDTARLRGAGTVSGSGKAVGSPYYMAPEAWRDHSGIDRRVDVWSLGVVLYQCLSGELPFVASNVYHLMRVIATRRPKSLAKKVGQDVWHIVERALQVDREQRWLNMHEFADVIERVRDMRGWDSSEITSAKSLMEGATQVAAPTPSATATAPAVTVLPPVKKPVQPPQPTQNKRIMPKPQRKDKWL